MVEEDPRRLLLLVRARRQPRPLADLHAAVPRVGRNERTWLRCGWWSWRGGDGDDGEGKKAMAVAPAAAAAEAAARASEGSGSEGGDRSPVQRKRTSPAATARAVTSPVPWRDCASRAAAKQPTAGVTTELRRRTRMASRAPTRRGATAGQSDFTPERRFLAILPRVLNPCLVPQSPIRGTVCRVSTCGAELLHANIAILATVGPAVRC